jgi:hypothetical protein
MYPRYSETLLKELLDKLADEQTVLTSAQSDPHGFIDNFSGFLWRFIGKLGGDGIFQTSRLG